MVSTPSAYSAVGSDPAGSATAPAFMPVTWLAAASTFSTHDCCGAGGVSVVVSASADDTLVRNFADFASVSPTYQRSSARPAPTIAVSDADTAQLTDASSCVTATGYTVPSFSSCNSSAVPSPYSCAKPEQSNIIQVARFSPCRPNGMLTGGRCTFTLMFFVRSTSYHFHSIIAYSAQLSAHPVAVLGKTILLLYFSPHCRYRSGCNSAIPVPAFPG